MNKIEIKQELVNRNTHKFYCDNCNKFLGESEEYGDGYYEEFGKFYLNFFVDGNWYKLNKHLCNNCRIKLLADIKQMLQKMDFRKGVDI